MPAFMTDPYEIPSMAMQIIGAPRFRNASFTGIISRHLQLRPENNHNNGKDYLRGELQKKILEHAEFLPEFVLAGPSLTAEIGIVESGQFKLTAFNMPNLEKAYDVRRVGSIGYGVFLIRFFASIDWIRLDKMPWFRMLNET